MSWPSTPGKRNHRSIVAARPLRFQARDMATRVEEGPVPLLAAVAGGTVADQPDGPSGADAGRQRPRPAAEPPTDPFQRSSRSPIASPRGAALTSASGEEGSQGRDHLPSIFMVQRPSERLRGKGLSRGEVPIGTETGQEKAGPITLDIESRSGSPHGIVID